MTSSDIEELLQEPVNQPARPVRNKETLATEYKMTATMVQVANACGQDFLKHFNSHLSLLKQVHLLKHGSQLDSTQNGVVKVYQVMSIIDNFNWAVTDSHKFSACYN